MKRLIYIFEALALMLGLNACTAEIVAPMQVSGDCLIEEIALDDYAGTVDLLTRTVEVRLPMGYDAATMKVSKLTLSSGADCNVRQGETLNMNTARVLKVTNGDVCLDWTLSILRDEALITQFVVNDIYAGAIDQDARTITITVPASVGVTHLVPTITYSKYATVTPAPGVAQDFTNPVTYTVKNNTAETAYVVTVTAIGKPKALFVGSAATMEELDPEARTACEWMMANVPSTLYASFADLRIGTNDMSDCKLIWWHWHMDWGVDGHNGFEEKGQDALSTRNQLREFYENGGPCSLPVMQPICLPSSVSRVTTSGPLRTTAGAVPRIAQNSAAVPGTSISTPVRKPTLCSRIWFRAMTPTRCTAPMPATTSPTPRPSTTSAPTGAATMTTQTGKPVRAARSWAWAATAPWWPGNMNPRMARAVSSASAPAATTGTPTPMRTVMPRSSTRTSKSSPRTQSTT